MTDAELGKLARTLAQHAETIAARCRAMENAIATGQVFGVPVSRRKIDAALHDIENRMVQAAELIGLHK